MSKSNTLSKQSNVQEIHQEQWIPFLAEFTRENRGAHARLEIIGADSDVGFQVETENRPFDGVSADIKDGERTVWITFGSTTTDHLSHGVHGAVAIRMLPLTRTHRRSVGDRKRRWHEKHPLSGGARSICAAARPLTSSPRRRYR